MEEDKEIRDQEDQADNDEMGFLDHLEELRWRIIKSVIGIVIGAIIVGIFIDDIMKYVIFAPAKHTEPP